MSRLSTWRRKAADTTYKYPDAVLGALGISLFLLGVRLHKGDTHVG